jgi:pyrroline-5-carboxylate reductase
MASASNSPTGTLAIVGGGNMGAALAGGLLAAGVVGPSSLAIVEVSNDRRVTLESMFPGVSVSSTIPPCSSAVIAVKPPDVPAATAAATAAGARRILSIAAGVTLRTLESAAGSGVAVVRSMPNTPALVGEGASAIAAGSSATDDDLRWAEHVLGSVGMVVRVPEEQLDAVTGLAGSGPAYLFLVAESLIEAGVAAGLPADVSDRLVRQLLVGSAALLAQGEAPADLRVKVTSPGGTTAAGLHVLDERALRQALVDAVAAATSRSRELGAS